MGPVKYQLSKREYVFIATLNLWRQKRMVFYLLLLIALLIISWSVEVPTYSYVVSVVIVFICLPLSTVFHFNKIVKTNPDLFTSETTLSADSEGIKLNYAAKSSALNWSVFKKWTANNKYILLHYDTLQPSVIPKRAFTNEQLTEFKNLLSEKIWPFPGDKWTSDERYAKRAVVLAVTSFILSSPFLTLPFISIFFMLFTKSECPAYIFGPLALLGLLSSLPMAIIAYRMGKRMKGSFTMINLTRILSLLAILAFSFSIIMMIIAPIICRYGPGW